MVAIPVLIYAKTSLQFIELVSTVSCDMCRSDKKKLLEASLASASLRADCLVKAAPTQSGDPYSLQLVGRLSNT